MPRIRISQVAERKEAATWQQTIVDRIKAGKVVPFIIHLVDHNLILGGNTALVEAYADYVQYPLADKHNLPQMAQFKGVTDESISDAWALKTDYINFIKNRLFDLAETEGAAEEILAEVEELFDDISFSEFSGRLGYPRFNQGPSDPLLILAELPLPIYLTTSYHGFIEAALKRAGKEPRTEICRWHKGLEGIPSVFEADYQPSKEAPLVYHLHGLDAYPESLVLTENDYLEFLVATSQDMGRGTDPIPKRVRQAMADSSLILMGYSLQSLEFKVVFWGLIRPRPLQHTSVSIQLLPSDHERKFLQEYLRREAKFEVYWGDIQEYVQELRQALE
ncbi:MAG: SIR2 family protein [Anaerolineales bacterium]|nr:SIR2 family protein [Anaerolineales bacterium]